MAFLDVLSDLYHLMNKMLDFLKKALKNARNFYKFKKSYIRLIINN